MPYDIICPSCGFRNTAGSTSCGSCNYPLQPIAGPHDPRDESAPGDDPGGGAPPRLLRRPHRRAAPMAGQSMWLWLLFGSIGVVILLWTAIDANRQRNVAQPPAVEGSSPDQQKAIDAARAALATDSTDVEAHVALANVLYDTGHWDEAIVHYRAVLRRDSTRVSPMVDMGVSYYNLGATDEAEALFQRALRLDPRQPIALFNLGIVSERRGRAPEALEYYRRAVEGAPSSELRDAILAAVKRTSEKAGTPAPR